MVQQRLTEDLKTAMKSGDELRRETLRMALAAIQNRELEKGALGDEEVLDILRKEAKKREDAAAIYERSGRAEHAEKEKQEIKIIAQYLPVRMQEDDVRKEVQRILGKLSSRDIGPAMKSVMAELRGKADAGLISKIVKEELSQQ